MSHIARKARGAGLDGRGSHRLWPEPAFYLLAQRAFGSARTGSVFAFAPFIGAAIAIALGDRSGTWVMAVGGLLMVLGVVLHLAESHGHEHAHERLEHEH